MWSNESKLHQYGLVLLFRALPSNKVANHKVVLKEIVTAYFRKGDEEVAKL